MLKRSNLWPKLPINYRGTIIIAIPATCLFLTLGSWIGLRYLWLDQSRQAARQEQIIVKSNQLLKTLIDAETAIRGYSLIRKKNFLVPYRRAMTTLEPSLAGLEQLLSTDPQQFQKRQAIKKLTQQQVGILKQWLALIEQPAIGSDPSSQINSLMAQGREVMDSLRASLDELESQEQTLLQVHQQRLNQLSAQIRWVIIILALIGFTACMVAIGLFNRIVQELEIREQQLSKSKSLIEAITTHMVDGVVTLNQHDKIETFNLSAAKMFGYGSDEIVGEKIESLLIDPLTSESDRQTIVDHLNSTLLSLKQSWQTMGYPKSGKPFPIEISVSQIDLEGWRIALIRDISERQKAQIELQARADKLTQLSQILATTNRALEQQNQELDQFVYVASHDLKAPLRAIANLSEWIEEDLAEKLSEESVYQMKLLRGRVYRLQSLIDGLLGYSRIGRSRTVLETFNVEDLLQEIIKSLTPSPAFTIKIGEEMPLLTARKWLFRQLFSNLIDNAIKHHHCPLGHIQISVQDQGDFYQFAVADDGPGIAHDFHKKIFVLFQTIFARDVKENSGIGLAIAKKIVETEGGKIWLKSDEGVGSTFYFTWPKISTN